MLIHRWHVLLLSLCSWVFMNFLFSMEKKEQSPILSLRETQISIILNNPSKNVDQYKNLVSEVLQKNFNTRIGLDQDKQERKNNELYNLLEDNASLYSILEIVQAGADMMSLPYDAGKLVCSGEARAILFLSCGGNYELLKNGETEIIKNIFLLCQQFFTTIIDVQALCKIIYLLKQKGIVINFSCYGENNTLLSPLHIAVYYSNYELVKKLLKQGAFSSMMDSYNKTPLDVSEAHYKADESSFKDTENILKIIDVLQKHGAQYAPRKDEIMISSTGKNKCLCS